MADRFDSRGRKLHRGETQRPDGTYCYRVMKSGEKYQIYAQTLPELRRREEGLMADIRDGINHSCITLNQAVDKFFERKNNIRPSTMSTYKALYDEHIRRGLGGKQIAKISYSDILNTYISMKRSYSTVTVLNALLQQVFDRAVKDCIIRFNLTVGATSEAKAHCTFGREVYVPTQEEQDAFLNYCHDSEYSFYYPMFVTLQGSGLRASELCGLTWSDINFEHGTLSVNRIVVYKDFGDGSKYHLGATKTASSVRTIPLLPQVRKALIMQRQSNFERGFKACEIDGQTLDLVFRDVDGKPMSDQTMNRILKYVIRDHNVIEEVVASRADGYKPFIIHGFTCHAWRHNFATELCRSTPDLTVVKATMGHSRIETTMNIYASATKENTEIAFDELARRMNKIG